MKLHVDEYGSGPPLVILHGLLGSSDNWRSVSRKLASSFTVLAVDQRNHGQSPHSNTLTYETMAQDVLELLDHRGDEAAHIIGHSMGGKTAMEFALNNPSRADRLIVVDIAPKEYPPYHEHLVEALTNLELSNVSSRQDADQALRNAIPEPPIRQFLLKNLERVASGEYRWQPNLESIQENYPNLTRPITAGTTFSGPTLFIRGEFSDYITDEDVTAIRELFPNSQAITIPEAGHWVHADQPDMFLRVVEQFLEGKTVQDALADEP